LSRDNFIGPILGPIFFNFLKLYRGFSFIISIDKSKLDSFRESKIGLIIIITPNLYRV